MALLVAVAGAITAPTVIAQNPPPRPAGAPPDSAAQAAARRDSAGSVAERGARGQVSIMREVFSYGNRGRRDPMVSLMNSSEIRPLITEVEVIGIMFAGTNSVATLRNLTDRKIIYRVKNGDGLGRMKVAQITATEVVFTIDEFGFSRTERLPIRPDTTARTP
jgi:hypothetical protein